MLKYYRDYYWKKGKPYGLDPVEIPDQEAITYKIVVDPYYKRFSLEKYKRGHFEKIIYDSSLLDFRHLNPIEQQAWQKEILEETPTSMKCLLRNQDDRAILFENYEFERGRCRACSFISIHGILLAKHCLYYSDFGDSFNGIILYDIEGRPIMKKMYEIDSSTGEFGTLLSEEWVLH